MPDCAILGERAKKGVAFDETDDKTWTDSGDTIHIHAGIGHVDKVGEWSAGCQVIAGTWTGAPSGSGGFLIKKKEGKIFLFFK